MPTYTTAATVRAQAAPRALLQDDDELDAVILLAEADVDRKLPDPRPVEGGRKLTVNNLDAGTVESLAEATAHQVLYRLHMGFAFFIESHQQVGGKDYSTAGAPPKFSPMTLDVLRDCGLLASSGRASSGRYSRGGVVSVSQSRWDW